MSQQNSPQRPRDIVRSLAPKVSQALQRPKDIVRNMYNSMPVSHLAKGDLPGYKQSLGQAFNREFKNPVNAAMNFMPMGAMAGTIKKAIPKIHPEDVNVIDEFSDYVRSGLAKKEPNLQLEQGASDLAERYVHTGKQPKTVHSLANRLQSFVKRSEKPNFKINKLK